MEFITEATKYVFNDQYFWGSMAFVSMMGIFIGAIVYNGDLKELKKAIVMLVSYALLLIMVNLSRIIPILSGVANKHQPMAGIVTIAIVTFFYLLGMQLGVVIVKHARSGNIDKEVII